MRRTKLGIMAAGITLGAFVSASAEEQSWSKRTPPPVKFAPPPDGERAPDWSGFHMGVNAGAGFGTKRRDSAVPDTFALPK